VYGGVYPPAFALCIQKLDEMAAQVIQDYLDELFSHLTLVAANSAMGSKKSERMGQHDC